MRMTFWARARAGRDRSGNGPVRQSVPNARGPDCCGNQANLRRLQPKLVIGAVNDPLERKADVAADRVMHMAEPQLSPSGLPALRRKCADCEANEHALQREGTSETAAPAATAPPAVDAVLSQPGRPLDAVTHDFMGRGFGADFGDVRIHTDTEAAQSAAAVHARAYTVGSNIVFGAGQFDPAGAGGRHLLAHELAHVVQQRETPSLTVRRAPPGDEPPQRDQGGLVERPERWPYGSTELSTKAIEWRRRNPEVSTDVNLIAFEFVWSKPGMAHAKTETEMLTSVPNVAHSEKMMDQYLIDFQKKQGPGTRVTLKRIFSERQFCGGEHGCHTYLMKKYPQAKKEFAYNYQTEGPASYRRKGEKTTTTRSVVSERIAAFRDGGQGQDHSADKDPPPHFEDAGGTMKSAVRDPAKLPSEKRAEKAAETAEKPQHSGTDATSGESAKTTPATKQQPAQEPAQPVTKPSTGPAKPTTPVEPAPSATKPTEIPKTSTAPHEPQTQSSRSPAPEPEPKSSKQPARKAGQNEDTAPSRPPTRRTVPSDEAPRVKPSAAKRVPSKPSATSTPPEPHPSAKPSTEPGSKPGTTHESGSAHQAESTGHGSAGAGTAHLAMRLLNTVVSQFSGDLAKTARANVHDPELTAVLDMVDDAMQVMNFVEDPKGFTANWIKAELIGRVFRHFLDSLAKSESDYVSRFPDPAAFGKDPLQTGVSLEEYRTDYERERLLYVTAVGDPYRRVRILGAQLNNAHLSRLEGLKLINEAMRNHDPAGAKAQYDSSSAYYAAALQTVVNALASAKAGVESQSKDFQQMLWRRGQVLEKMSAECADFSQRLTAYLIVPGIDMAVVDFQTLSEGFEEIAGGFFQFATLVDGRKQLYDDAHRKAKAALEHVDADRQSLLGR
jgi:hypothetical protein